MAQLNLQLATITKEYNNYETLPPGWYKAVISDSELAETSKRDGMMLILTFAIVEGQYSNRKVTKRYNISNPNPAAVEIAMSEIKAICSCVGIFDALTHSEQLHGRGIQIKLVTQKDSDYNDVKGYKDQYGNDPGKSGQGAPAPVQQQPPQGYAQPAYQPPAAPAAPPAWAPQGQPQAPASFGQPQPPQQQPPQAPAWQQPAPAAQAAQPQQPYQQPAAPAPAWQPNGPGPSAPAWAAPPQR